MSERKDGGPAYPRPTSTDEHDLPCNVYQDQQGMSLRDWFAGQALAGMGTWAPVYDSRSSIKTLLSPEVQEDRARWAYEQADAMLKERDR